MIIVIFLSLLFALAVQASLSFMEKKGIKEARKGLLEYFLIRKYQRIFDFLGKIGYTIVVVCGGTTILVFEALDRLLNLFHMSPLFCLEENILSFLFLYVNILLYILLYI